MIVILFITMSSNRRINPSFLLGNQNIPYGHVYPEYFGYPYHPYHPHYQYFNYPPLTYYPPMPIPPRVYHQEGRTK